MTIGAFDLDATLADLHSDEGADPVMALAPMSPTWLAALVLVFATPN
jgi:hypothetical protein